MDIKDTKIEQQTDEEMLTDLEERTEKLREFNNDVEKKYGPIAEKCLSLDESEIAGPEEDVTEQAVLEADIDTQLNEAIIALATDEDTIEE
jgi:hypothetical protein